MSSVAYQAVTDMAQAAPAVRSAQVTYAPTTPTPAPKPAKAFTTPTVKPSGGPLQVDPNSPLAQGQNKNNSPNTNFQAAPGHSRDIQGFTDNGDGTAFGSDGTLYYMANAGGDDDLWAVYNPADVGKKTTNWGLQNAQKRYQGATADSPKSSVLTGVNDSTAGPDPSVTEAASSGLFSAIDDYNKAVTEAMKGATGAQRAFQDKFTTDEAAIQSLGSSSARFSGVNSAGTVTGASAANHTATGVEQMGVVTKKAQSAYQDLVSAATTTEIGALKDFADLDVSTQQAAVSDAVSKWKTAVSGALQSGDEAANQQLAQLNDAVSAWQGALKGSADKQNKLMAILKLVGGAVAVAAGAVASVTGVGAVVGAPLIAGGVGLIGAGATDPNLRN